MLANERCSRTATSGVSLDNAFDLIEGHPQEKSGRLAVAPLAQEGWDLQVVGVVADVHAAADGVDRGGLIEGSGSGSVGPRRNVL